MFKKRKTNKKIKHKNVQPKNKGITLIALVVTIIVLVILAGVSINTLFGDNGLIKKANDSVDEDAKGKARDKVSMEVLSSFNNDGTLNPNKLKTNIENHTGGTAELGDNNGLPVTVTVDGYTFQVEGKGEITGDGEPATQVDYASEDTSFVGYYADLDGDASNGPEGIIYADLAVGSELALGSENAVEGMRKWNNYDMSVYKYDVEKEDLKKYTVGSEEVTGFGTTWKKPMITETSGGGTTERFYVMALKDFDNKVHAWYENASGKLDTTKVVDGGANDFKEGKANTEYWIDVNEGKENASFQDESKYGALKDNDIWKLLNENLNEYGREWFVPSKSEWSAFGDMCYKLMNMTDSSSSYNQTFGLSDYYCSSSQFNTNYAYTANFYDGNINIGNVNLNCYVRLSATF